MTTDSTPLAEPLPCPFCGAEPRQRRVQDESLYSHATVTYLQIVCDECDAQSVSSEDHDDVIARWNHRATPAAAAEIAQPAVPEPLTDGQIIALFVELNVASTTADSPTAMFKVIVRAVEAAHGIGATQAQPATHAEVLTERQFAEWLNDRRMHDVSSVFHDIVLHYRAAIATQAAQQPKDLGVSLRAGLSAPLRSAAIPDAACPGRSGE